MAKKRIVVGMSGASGAPLAVEVLRQLKGLEELEIHLVMTHGAECTLKQETDLTKEQVKALCDVYHENENIGACLASGSFLTEGMIVVPCSMKTVAGIACGYSDSLLLRCADVTLKEGRKLVLAARESPLSSIHLKNLCELSRMGAVIMPPMLSFYHRPATLEECTRQIAGRILRQFGFSGEVLEWGGME